MTSTTGRKTNRAGFTLLELILVMVLICTVLAMAAPSLRGFFGSRKTDDESARILALIQYARSQSITEGRVYRLNFDMDQGQYWLTAQNGSAFDRLMTEFGRVFAFPEGTTGQWDSQLGDTTRSYLEFHPNGRTDAAVIRLTDRQGKAFDIQCLSPTERFRILSPQQEEKG